MRPEIEQFWNLVRRLTGLENGEFDIDLSVLTCREVDSLSRIIAEVRESERQRMRQRAARLFQVAL